jgi:Radial spokehead-like protein
VNYLRAQIARISAATQICPGGYYLLDDEEDFDEEGSAREFLSFPFHEQFSSNFAAPFNLVENPQYKPPSFQELSQPHMKFWMHCGQYVLRQGRTEFYDAFEANQDEDDQVEDDENKVRKPKYPVWYPEKADWYEPEAAVPPPLCSVMNDAGQFINGNLRLSRPFHDHFSKKERGEYCF